MTVQRYNPKDIETKWQNEWEASGIYRATEDPSRPKKYILEYFPYPSGAAMHVGHVRNYTIGDVMARFARMNGYNVLHPMGWDGFGLPAENYAIKTGISPRQAIDENTAKFKQQLMQMGFSYDWSREIDSTDPKYYKWTQWFFLMLFRLGLAYQQESLQWWCPVDKTVLANEQVENGVCWRCGSPVEKKALKQWFFRITAYADRLAKDLDEVDWSDSIKAMQRNWIGRSRGAEIEFPLALPVSSQLLLECGDESVQDEEHHARWEVVGGKLLDGASEDEASEIYSEIVPEIIDGLVDDGYQSTVDRLRNQYHVTESPFIKVFTTRPDTIFGATFMVLSPEHPLVDQITTPEHKQHVRTYQKAAQAKSDIERQETDREKTGVFTGAYAVNPASNQKIPVWIADYVLMGYGTGAIMAVPAHDERDYEFAQKFNLPIVPVVGPVTGQKQGDEAEKDAIVAVLRNPKTDEVLMLDWGPRQERWGGSLFIGGGVDQGEDEVACAAREIAEETGYVNVKHTATLPFLVHSYYFSNVKNKNYYARMRGLLFDLVDETQDLQKLDDGEKGKFTLKWVDAGQAAQLSDDDGHRYIYEALMRRGCYHGEGLMLNSRGYDGMSSSEAREKIVKNLEQKGVAREVTNYKMRDWLISRQRYWGAPIPIIHCPEHGAVPVPEDQLPVKLPELTKFEPLPDRDGDGRSPLANDKDWVDTVCPICGKPAQRETDTMDGFACSSWYFLRFADPHNHQKPFSKDKVDFWLPVNDYIGGAEHAVMHLLYARFWTKVMQDEGLIDFGEPFKTLRNQGMILAPDGQKMSKSKGNTIEPGVLIDQGYGADAIRIMELFIGPWNQAANWSVEGMAGAYRFLQRVWTLVQEYNDSEGGSGELPQLQKALHKTVKKVSGDIETMSFNTAIAALMEFVNELFRLKAADKYQSVEWQNALEMLVQLLAPFAPHLAEELWHQLGHEESVHLSRWPGYDEQYLIEDSVTVVVQVNGKVRTQISVPAGSSQAEVAEAAQGDQKVRPYLEGKTLRRTVYVPDKLVNFVV